MSEKKRQGPPAEGRWFWLHNESIDLVQKAGPTAFCVLAFLARCCNQQRTCHPSMQGIAKALGVSTNTARRGVQAIELAGAISVERLPNRRSVYHLLPTSCTPTSGRAEGDPHSQPWEGESDMVAAESELPENAGLAPEQVRAKVLAEYGLEADGRPPHSHEREGKSNSGLPSVGGGTPMDGRSCTPTSGSQTRPIEQDPRNKRRGSRTSKDVSPKLLEVITAWNSLPDGIVRQRVKSDPIAKGVLKAWNRVQNNPDALACYDDVPKLFGFVRKATWAHDQDFMKLNRFLGKTKKDEWFAQNFLDGDYRNDRRNGRARRTDNSPMGEF